jgi:hypothetical protein
MVVAFGSLFNEIYIDKTESGGVKSFLVPIAYAPKEKYKVRLAGDPNLQNPNQIVLPRMAFEITGYAYDSVRKRNSTTRFLLRDSNPASGVDFAYAEVPYNIDFGLYIYVRNMEDGLRIVEQILPQFSPEFVVTVNFDSNFKKIDVPIFLNSVSSEEDYEGDYFGNRRSIIFTLNFTMKTYLFGSKKTYKEIRVAQSSLLDGRVFDEDAPVGLTFDPDGINTEFAKVIVGISGPSGASSGISNYDAYARLQELQTEGSVFYHQDMASGGITTDWLSRSAERFGGSEVVGTISLASELPWTANFAVYSPINDRIYLRMFDTTASGVVGVTSPVVIIDPSTNTVESVISLPAFVASMQYNTINDKIYIYSGQSPTLSGGYFDVLVFDPTTNTVTETINLSKTTPLLPGVTFSSFTGQSSLAFNPTNNRLYVGVSVSPIDTINGTTGAAYCIDCSTNTVIGDPILLGKSFQIGISLVCYCPINDTIYLISPLGSTTFLGSNYEPKINLIDSKTNTVIGEIPFGPFDSRQTLQYRFITSILYCERSEKLYVFGISRAVDSGPYVTEIVSIDPKNGNKLEFIGYTEPSISTNPSSNVYSPVTKKIYFNGGGFPIDVGNFNAVGVLDPETNNILDSIPILPSDYFTNALLYCPSNQKVYATVRNTALDSFLIVIS